MERLKMKHISQKLFLGMMVLVMGLLITLWAFNIAFLEKGYLEGKAEELTASGQKLQKLVNQNDANSAKYIEQLAASNNIGTLILNIYDLPTYASGEFLGGMLRDCAAKAGQVHKNKILLDYVERESYNMRYVRVGLPLDGGGTLFLVSPVSDVAATVEILKGQFVKLSVMIILSALIIGAILSKILTRPIIKIEERAMQMAKGDLQTPFVPTTQDEMGRLALTMESLRKSLQQVDALSRELIANVSHELRTPLAIIRGFAETVRDVSWKNDAKREKHLGAIIEESRRLERVVNDILDYSQLQSGALSYDMKRINAGEICEGVCSKMEEYLSGRGITLISEINENIYVLADTTKLEQVLLNLIGNAFNHSPEGSRVWVKLESDHENAYFKIIDEGEGIEEAELDRIWDRYYRATLRNREERIGTGLGLAVCKSILKAHDANYYVNSVVGEGSEFGFSLALYRFDG